MAKRVALLSRIANPNIGHTLMHAGVERAIRRVLGADVAIVQLEQHAVYSSLFPRRHPLAWLDQLPDWPQRRALLGRPLKNLMLTERMVEWSARFVREDLRGLDLAVSVGGPALTSGMSASTQIKQVVILQPAALKAVGVPVVHVGLGSCFPYPTLRPRLTLPADEIAARRLVDAATTTIVRDPLAQTVMSDLGLNTPLLACPVFIAMDDAPRPTKGRPRIVINYMDRFPLSESHQIDRIDIRSDGFLRGVRRLLSVFGRDYEFVFSCHNQHEIELAAQFGTDVKIVVPATTEDYQDLAKDAVAVVAGRIHCAIPLAAAGVPGIVVGTDSRLRTCEFIGLTSMFLGDVTPELLEAEVVRLIASGAAERDRLLALRRRTFEAYCDLFAATMRAA